MCGEIVGGVEGGVGWRVEGEFGGVIGDGVFGVVVVVVVLELVGFGVEAAVV